MSASRTHAGAQPDGDPLRFLLVTVATAVLAILVFFGASSLLVLHVVEPHDNVKRSLDLLRETRVKAAAFGDSRMTFDFPAGRGVVNLAYPGENVFDMRRRVELWLDNNPDARAAVVQADGHLFSRYRTGSTLKSYLERQDGSLHILPFDRRHLPFLMSYWGVFFGGGGFTSKFVFHDSGWQTYEANLSDLPVEEQRAQALGRAQQQQPMTDFGQTEAAEAYRGLLRMLELRNVVTCLVMTPMAEPALAATARVSDIDPRPVFAEMAQAAGARFVDLSHLLPKAEDVALYADGDHLNPTGAPAFDKAVREACALPDQG